VIKTAILRVIICAWPHTRSICVCCDLTQILTSALRHQVLVRTDVITYKAVINVSVLMGRSCSPTASPALVQLDLVTYYTRDL